MQSESTDYLIIGAGATGLSFADTLIEQTDAQITIVDKHALPGGHWNDAYPFVALHQPSAFYGVNSLPLGTGHKDTHGPNAGMFELASGAEVSGYFQRVMHQKLIPSGRVRYLPMSEFLGVSGNVGSVRGIFSGQKSQITVRKKWVDATFFTPQVPATAAPAFAVADGVSFVTPTQLTQLWQRQGQSPGQDGPEHFCVLGAGKTAMDACLWLLNWGVQPESIHWVMPRDSWLINRLTTQPGEEFFKYSMGGVAHQLKAMSEATSVNDLFERLEASSQMLRIDRTRQPAMMHYATCSQAEVAQLARIKQVLRLGRVQSIEPNALVFEQSRQTMPKDTVYVNCTASAVLPRANGPMFQGNKILPQLVRLPLISFSAAVCAFVEANYDDEATKNQLCVPVPFPQSPAGYIAATLGNMANQQRWGQEKALRNWMRDSRLDGFGKLTASVSVEDSEKMAILNDIRHYSMAAVGNGKKLLATQ